MLVLPMAAPRSHLVPTIGLNQPYGFPDLHSRRIPACARGLKVPSWLRVQHPDGDAGSGARTMDDGAWPEVKSGWRRRRRSEEGEARKRSATRGGVRRAVPAAARPGYVPKTKRGSAPLPRAEGRQRRRSAEALRYQRGGRKAIPAAARGASACAARASGPRSKRRHGVSAERKPAKAGTTSAAGNGSYAIRASGRLNFQRRSRMVGRYTDMLDS